MKGLLASLTQGGDGIVTKRFTPDPGVVKVAWVERKGVKTPLLTVPISSTGDDRDGDAFSTEGIQDLVRQLKTGKVPFYLDHGRKAGEFMPSYSVLDMRGKWVDGEVRDGNLVFGTAELDGGDEQAMELVRKTEAGLPIGYSVGFKLRRSEDKKDANGNPSGGRLFHQTDLMETSAVGIPANPDAVHLASIKNAAQARGITEDRLARAIEVALSNIQKEAPTMEPTPQELAQLDAQRKAGLNGLAVPAPAVQDQKTAAPLTEAGLKAALAEQAKTIGSEVGKAIGDALKAAKPKDDETEDDSTKAGEDESDPAPAPKNAKGKKEGDKDDEDDPKPAPKSAPKPVKKTAQPRGMVTMGDGKAADPDASQDTAEKAVQPFEFA